MKRTVGALMAIVVGAASLTPATASAQDRRHYRSHHYSYNHDRHGDAVAAGVVGLALGAIIGAAVTDSNHRHRCYDRCGYDGRYYGDGYYRDSYYDDDDGPALCVVREHRYDPYSGREVFIEERRPC